jgi:hypothetical protein
LFSSGFDCYDIFHVFSCAKGPYGGPVETNNNGQETSNNGGEGAAFHSLVPLGDFKVVLGVDDRDDALSRYCLLTATYTIEQYCRRALFVHRHFERFDYAGDALFDLREYPVQEVLALYALFHAAGPELAEPGLYDLLPELEAGEGPGPDIPHALRISPALGRLPGLAGFKAGYSTGMTPADLASACLELAAWNLERYRGRYRGRRIGVTGNAKNGERLESSMPENVRQLLEPYKRRMI